MPRPDPGAVDELDFYTKGYQSNLVATEQAFFKSLWLYLALDQISKHDPPMPFFQSYFVIWSKQSNKLEPVHQFKCGFDLN